jgi:hypothetical protein
MTIIAGIDEAGLGPVMGPLVVSASVFRVPDAVAGQCLWQLLSPGICKKPLKKSGALAVADSKEMHVRSDGVVHLERGLLGMMSLLGPMPGSMRELLRRLAPACLDQLSGYPWYHGADLTLPRHADPIDLLLRLNGARSAMEARGVTLEALRSEPVLTGQYNQLLSATRNKSMALWSIVSRLIAYVVNTYGRAGQGLRLVVDRQGGRTQYHEALGRMFEGAQIKILRQTPRQSVYHLDWEGRSFEIAFLVDGEDAAMPCALASMACKYIRELLMELENAWWAARVPGIKPTAGYYADGTRFLKEIAPALAQQGVDRALVARMW